MSFRSGINLSPERLGKFLKGMWRASRLGSTAIGSPRTSFFKGYPATDLRYLLDGLVCTNSDCSNIDGPSYYFESENRVILYNNLLLVLKCSTGPSRSKDTGLAETMETACMPFFESLSFIR
jgi:hypothetical protein